MAFGWINSFFNKQLPDVTTYDAAVPLTKEEKDFCSNYIDHNSAAIAYILTFKDQSNEGTAFFLGKQLLNKPKIQNYLADLCRQRLKDFEPSREQLVIDLKDIQKRCLVSGDPIFMEVEGGGAVFTGEYKFIDVKSALKAIELQAKTLGYFTDAPVNNFTQNTNIANIANLSDMELDDQLRLITQQKNIPQIINIPAQHTQHTTNTDNVAENTTKEPMEQTKGKQKEQKYELLTDLY